MDYTSVSDAFCIPDMLLNFNNMVFEFNYMTITINERGPR